MEWDRWFPDAVVVAPATITSAAQALAGAPPASNPCLFQSLLTSIVVAPPAFEAATRTLDLPDLGSARVLEHSIEFYREIEARDSISFGVQIMAMSDLDGQSAGLPVRVHAFTTQRTGDSRLCTLRFVFPVDGALRDRMSEFSSKQTALVPGPPVVSPESIRDSYMRARARSPINLDHSTWDRSDHAERLHSGVTDEVRRMEPMLSSADVAAILGVSVRTVNRWAGNGAVKSTVLPGGARRFLLRDIEDALMPPPGDTDVARPGR